MSERALCVFLSAALLLPIATLAHEGLDTQLHALDHALEKKPGDPELYLQRGRAWMELREYRKAGEDFESALRLDPADYLIARFYLAESLLFAGELAAAEKQARQYAASVATLNAVTQANASWLLGDILLQQNRAADAAEAYARAYGFGQALSPDMVLRYVTALERTGRRREAIAILEEVLKKPEPAAILKDRLAALKSPAAKP